MARHPDGGTRTFIEQKRRAQLIDVTIAMVAEHGYAGTSLSRIAGGAGITKAAVLYHFPTKDAVVAAAYQHVLTALVTRVAAAVEAAPATDGPAAYVRTMIAHLHEHPEHTRMLTEALTSTETQDQGSSGRWHALAQIVAAARAARGLDEHADLRTAAIIVGGAIDALVGERLRDPAYDTITAAEELVGMIERTLLT
ncbi:TetR/AcrR family transcriptional regulator [Pseudactinotalea suaedae]|uniref:TetR/AcrR family transcriptional regulator n=1 Tax=Pseudactinotalea suaedae TaxID=1524924 RepID=UPI001F4F9CA7|nr:TetR/AcrR family transcriptional regulator [Pseudactinotalea suaedae]